jgi:hypothetical protein
VQKSFFAIFALTFKWRSRATFRENFVYRHYFQHPLSRSRHAVYSRNMPIDRHSQHLDTGGAEQIK